MELTVSGYYAMVQIKNGFPRVERAFNSVTTALKEAKKLTKEHEGSEYVISWQFDIDDGKRLFAKIYHVDSKDRSRLPGNIFYMDSDSVARIGNYFGSRATLDGPGAWE